MKHEDLLKKLTLDEKAALTSGRDFWSTAEFKDKGIPSAYLSDGPHGLRKQAAASDHLGLNPSIPATCFPTAVGMANTWNVELGEGVGKRLGEEAASMHVNVLLGPAMNIKRNPLCGRDFEYFSEDPLLAGKMAAAYVKGIQSIGISACLKHFALNNQEERRMVSDSVCDERTLREIYLTGFEIAVEEGHPGAVMSSYNKINGVHANENMHIMREILRNEWSYDGVVVTDWAGENDRIQGLIAMNELEMPGCKYSNFDVIQAVTKGYTIPFAEKNDPKRYAYLKEGLVDGKLSMKVIDENLDRLLDLVLRTDAAIQKAPQTFDKDEHHEYARKCAQEAAVLLKNDNHALPLSKEDKVAVIGDFAKNPRYQGAGSSLVNPTRLDDFLDLVKEYPVSFVGYEKGYDRYGKKKKGLAKKALALAEKAQKILFFMGLDEVTECEGLDRKDMQIPANQLELLEKVLALRKPVIVVLFAGSAVLLDVPAKADAILDAYLGGQAGARALLDILTGAVSPSGKLSESMPFRYEDCSSASHFPGHGMTVEYREGLFVGYRYYETAKVAVRYPFGYGLSYTKFEYSGLSVDKEGVTFQVKNVGDYDGAEVTELYVGLKDSAVPRPLRELKGFAKVFLRKGEAKEVKIPFDKRTFRFYNVKSQAWEVETGDYAIEIGASSMDIRLSAPFHVEGNATAVAYTKDQIPSYFYGKVSNVSDEEFEALLGRPIPNAERPFINKRKTRMIITENCTVYDLRYGKGWVGRFFSHVIRHLYHFLWKIGKRSLANTIMMGVYHQPVRGLGKFGGMTRRMMEGLLLMFNGKFFRGLHYVFTKNKDVKAYAKAQKKAAKEAQKAAA